MATVLIESPQCAWDGVPLVQKAHESWPTFQKRLFCNRACFYAWRRAHHTRRAVLGTPQRIRRKASTLTPFALGALAAQTVKTIADQHEFWRGYHAAEE